MANQNNPANPVPGGQNRNRPNPPQPKLELKVYPSSEIRNEVFYLTVDVSAFLGTRPITNKAIILKERSSGILDNQNLDDNGEAVLRAKEKLTDQTKNLTLRVYIPGMQGEEIVTVVIPALSTSDPNLADPKTPDNDPEIMILRSYHDGCGNFSVMIRVLKRHGVGLSTPVTIWCQGSAYDITTDDKGEAVFRLRNQLAPGETEEIVVTVSGIEESSKIKLHYHQVNQCPYEKYTRDWFTRTNNGRAMILAYAFFFALFLAVTFGVGSGLLNDRTFRGEDGLSKQEQIYNRTVGVMAPQQTIQPTEEVKANWPTGFWKLSFILFVALVIYGPLAWREEIKEVITETAEKIFERSETKSSDPMLENLAKWLGGFNVVRRNPAPKIIVSGSDDQTSSPASNDGSGHHTGWQIFQISMISDLAFELAPKIFRKIFTK